MAPGCGVQVRGLIHVDWAIARRKHVQASDSRNGVGSGVSRRVAELEDGRGSESATAPCLAKRESGPSPVKGRNAGFDLGGEHIELCRECGIAQDVVQADPLVMVDK